MGLRVFFFRVLAPSLSACTSSNIVPANSLMSYKTSRGIQRRATIRIFNNLCESKNSRNWWRHLGNLSQTDPCWLQRLTCSSLRMRRNALLISKPLSVSFSDLRAVSRAGCVGELADIFCQMGSGNEASSGLVLNRSNTDKVAANQSHLSGECDIRDKG